jgi:hypothetical protein
MGRQWGLALLMQYRAVLVAAVIAGFTLVQMTVKQDL